MTTHSPHTRLKKVTKKVRTAKKTTIRHAKKRSR